MARQRRAERLLKTFGEEKKDDLTISTFMVLVDVPTQAQTCTLQSHHGMQQKQYTLKQRNTHSHPHIYTVLCMHAHKLTQRDRFTLSAHFFGMSIRLKSIWIEVNTIKISKQRLEKNFDENYSAQLPQTIPDGSKHEN